MSLMGKKISTFAKVSDLLDEIEGIQTEETDGADMKALLDEAAALSTAPVRRVPKTSRAFSISRESLEKILRDEVPKFRRLTKEESFSLFELFHSSEPFFGVDSASHCARASAVEIRNAISFWFEHFPITLDGIPEPTALSVDSVDSVDSVEAKNAYVRIFHRATNDSIGYVAVLPDQDIDDRDPITVPFESMRENMRRLYDPQRAPTVGTLLALTAVLAQRESELEALAEQKAKEPSSLSESEGFGSW